jgi:hypothetical protein
MRNRYLAAFQESYNVLGLASSVAISAATLNPLPLLVGLVAEAAYLIFVPDSSWYATHLSRRHDAEVQARRDELKAKTLPLLRVELQDRFIRLEETRREIDREAASDATWMREVLRKLDFLLEKFLHFGVKEEQFRAYLSEVREEVESSRNYQPAPRLVQNPRTGVINAVDRRPQPAPSPDEAWLRETVAVIQSAYDRDIAGVEANFEGETDASTRAILGKRLEVLRRRREFIGKIAKIVANLSHQLSLLEDTFGLISDELLARPPEQVLADIEDVVSQTNTMTQVLEEMAPYEQMLGSVARA